MLPREPDEHAPNGGARRTIETLVAFDRAPCSPGEQRAAEWIAERFRELGCEARVDQAEAWPGYAPPMAGMSVIGALAGTAALSGARTAGIVGGLAAGLGIADDASNGPRVFRRLTMRKRPTWNVIAHAGDRDAERTLVLLAHHDAAPTGRVFDPGPSELLARRFPDLVRGFKKGPPFFWGPVAAPLLVATAAAAGRRRLLAFGTFLCAVSAAAFTDIARSPVVPGANDNLSGVAGLIRFAELLRTRPIDGLRVMLVSCGSEETMQGGIYDFVRRHRAELPVERTWFINLDTIGNSQLLLVEGEGPLLIEDFDKGLRELVAAEAERAGISLRRDMRSRATSDTVVPLRAGYRAVHIGSVTEQGTQGHYHWPTDTPENVDYSAIERAVALTEAVARRIAAAQPASATPDAGVAAPRTG